VLNEHFGYLCGDGANDRPLAHDAQVYSADRVASTLNGVWLGGHRRV
jgi:hypothetical protein